jgi:hypothetical protein
MPNELLLTEPSKQALEMLRQLVPNVEDAFLTETALSLTAVLYTKSAEGATIRIRMPDGKEEELRFKVKKGSKRKEPLAEGK